MSMTPFPPLDRTAPSFKDDLDALFGTRVPNFVNELNTTTANLNSIAAGGAYAIPYTFNPSYSGTGGSGSLKTNGASQSAATFLVVQNIAASGASVRSQLQKFSASSSTIKGQIRLQKMGDPSRYLVFNVTSQDDLAEYQTVYVSIVDYSHPDPFTAGDSLMLYFQRTGDKGDVGPAGSLLVPRLHVREQYGSGNFGPALSSTNWTTRAMNTTVYSTLSGATVSGNQIALDPGTYDFRGWGGAVGTDGRHRVGLKNVTSGSFVAQGSSEFVGPNSYTTGGKSVLEGRVTISARTTFELQHYVAGSFSSGTPVSTGTAECYAELIFEKVA